MQRGHRQWVCLENTARALPRFHAALQMSALASLSEAPFTMVGMSQQPNSADSPWAVHQLNVQVKQWIERLGHIWVEAK